jgi:hypothetical protein
MIPRTIQKVFHETPLAINGPTANCPAEPPAVPNICVAPISRGGAGSREVLGRNVDGPDKGEDASGPLKETTDARGFATS